MESAKLLVILVSITMIFLAIQVSADNDAEVQNHIKELRKELFKNRGYDKMARPVKNYTHSVNVSIYLDVNYIKSIDISNNIMESEGWLRLTWLDENLKWKPSEFGGLEDIRVSVEEVFRPDITIINSVESENVIRTTTHSDLILWHTGELFWMPALSMKTVCAIDLTEWPFDQQTCIYRFASWTYEGNALDLQNASDKIDVSSFVDNSEWDLVTSSCTYKMHTYSVDAFYPEVIFSLTVSRKTTIYRYVIYLPVICVLLLNLMALWLDVRNSLRFHLSSLCFMTLLLIILYLGTKLGFGSVGIPRVIKYLGQMIVLTSVTLLWFAFSLNFLASRFEVPETIVRTLEPLQRWLVSYDVEAVQLTNSDPEDPSQANGPKPNTSPKPPKFSKNLIVIQIVDKLIFALFSLLVIFLHN